MEITNVGHQIHLVYKIIFLDIYIIICKYYYMEDQLLNIFQSMIIMTIINKILYKIAQFIHNTIDKSKYSNSYIFYVISIFKILFWRYYGHSFSYSCLLVFFPVILEEIQQVMNIFYEKTAKLGIIS